MPAPKTALIVIDIQNDYFPGGAFPLWNADGVLNSIETAVKTAQAKEIPVILVQHVADGPAPFFNPGTSGVEIHSRLQAIAGGAPVVVKTAADSFFDTTLATVLRDLGSEELLICGMMSQNCVTHTAISKAAEPYKVTVLSDCATTVSEILHKIALRALTTRIAVRDAATALAAA